MKQRPELILFAISILIFLMLFLGIMQGMGQPVRSPEKLPEASKESMDAPVATSPDVQVVFNADWVNSLPVPADPGKQELCLAEALYFEARGEPVKGQIAVAEVILNRVQSPRFPNTICDVVYQGGQRPNACQFSYACDGIREHFEELAAYERARRLASHLVNEGRAGLARGAQFYHAATVQPAWAGKLREVAKIGDHIFLRHSTSQPPEEELRK